MIIRTMRKHLALATSVVLALTLVLVSAQPSWAAKLPQDFDLTFDGYCDGMHIDTNNIGVQGNRTGCLTDPLVGIYSKKEVHVSFEESGAAVFTVIRIDGTWTYYVNTGSGIFVANEGTWSFGTPALTAVAGPSSTGR